jgi:Domain of unknown function (DUF2017)
MSSAFRKARGGGVRVTLSAEETAVVRVLVEQMLDLIGGTDEPKPDDGMPDLALSENSTISDDPVLARLFPDAYREDDEASAEFRRYTEVGLRDGKRANAELVLRTLGEGGEIVLDAEQAQAWLRALNDLRLALGTRLDVTEDTPPLLAADDPRGAPFAAYDWLTYLQESLVHAIPTTKH